MKMKRILVVLSMMAMLALTACSSDSGKVVMDGSSSVFPITEAVAEEFSKIEKDVKLSVGISGTGGGFKKFVKNEIDIADASREIKEEEKKSAENNGVEYIEFEIALDGLSVMVNPENTWVDYLTVEEMKMIWGPDSTVQTWADVREGWPAEPIKLYAPGTDSGTFEYFTHAINGKAGALRSDYTGSEDDNVLVQGIAGDKNAIGFFGFAYYEENKEILKIVPIDNGSGPITPTLETIQNGTYAPLSRPLYIYVNKESLKRPEVFSFVQFYMEKGGALAEEVGYVSLPAADYLNNLNVMKEN